MNKQGGGEKSTLCLAKRSNTWLDHSQSDFVLLFFPSFSSVLSSQLLHLAFRQEDGHLVRRDRLQRLHLDRVFDQVGDGFNSQFGHVVIVGALEDQSVPPLYVGYFLRFALRHEPSQLSCRSNSSLASNR